MEFTNEQRNELRVAQDEDGFWIVPKYGFGCALHKYAYKTREEAETSIRVLTVVRNLHASRPDLKKVTILSHEGRHQVIRKNSRKRMDETALTEWTSLDEVISYLNSEFGMVLDQ